MGLEAHNLLDRLGLAGLFPTSSLEKKILFQLKVLKKLQITL
jgi:hypothetical protein